MLDLQFSSLHVDAMGEKSPLPLPAPLQGREAAGYHPGEPVAQFELGDHRNFVYLILDRAARQAALIDPQEDVEPPLQALAAEGVTLQAVLLTHTHYDHVAGLEELLERLPGIPIYVHPLD